MNRLLIPVISGAVCVGAMIVCNTASLGARATLIASSASVTTAAAEAALDPLQQERGSRGTTTVQQFMQSLTAFGVWMSHPQFGWVWQPHDVQPWWQPFSIGDWIVTQNGSPYWRSGLPFGWATEHYGAWTYDDNKGWLWVPSNEWSAAPVSWRARDGIVGWAPQMATTANTQSVACPQPAWAWIFVASNRLLTTSNFVAAEAELTSRDAHGTWGAWANQPEGLGAARMPEPRNANLISATSCLGAADATDMFARARIDRGLSTKGPPITWVLRRSEMGSGRATNGRLPVYAPVITGNAPAVGGDFLSNPPAPRVQRAVLLARGQTVPPLAPAAPALPADRRTPVQPLPPALPAPAVVPAAPLSNYDAFTYQHEVLDEHNASERDALQQQHAADATTPPYPGFDQSTLPAWKQREMQELQRMAARQRKLLDAKQQALDDAANAPKTSTNEATVPVPAPVTAPVPAPATAPVTAPGIAPTPPPTATPSAP